LFKFFAINVVDTGGNFVADINDTGAKFATGISNTSGTGVVDTAGAPSK
jgi:hypothetical protein